MTKYSLPAIFKGVFRSIVGAYRDYELNLTASASTTDWCDIRGLQYGAVYNETGGQIVLTLYSAKKKDGTARALNDSGGNAATVTVPDGECWELPSEIKSASYLAPVLGSGTASGVWFHFEH